MLFSEVFKYSTWMADDLNGSKLNRNARNLPVGFFGRVLTKKIGEKMMNWRQVGIFEVFLISIIYRI
jgi:hypothetical protein